jgi:hypothetical protein
MSAPVAADPSPLPLRERWPEGSERGPGRVGGALSVSRAGNIGPQTRTAPPPSALPRQGGGVFGSRRGAEAQRLGAEVRRNLGVFVRVAVVLNSYLSSYFQIRNFASKRPNF